MLLVRDRHPEDPAADMALSEVLLRAVAGGTSPEVARVYRPGATMAFGRRDAHAPGFAAAQAAARAHGYTPVVRLGGGHAAGYDEGSVVVERFTRQDGLGGPIQARFADLAGVLEDALRAVGVTPVVGELPGEYCPGRWSLHAEGSAVKLAGLAQRSVRGAALATAVVVVEGGDRLRAALVDVYAALDLAWDPATAGALADVGHGVGVADVEAAVIDAIAARWPSASP